ncbi:MAG: SpoIIE family protein phosphatase [Azonexaceae bacterium]|nr:SpoIIE family protein phosphatase [Azonexaceae bacterium]
MIGFGTGLPPANMNRSFDKMKVLAVDDNRTNLHILQVFLKKLGHQVILAADGAQAVEKFAEEQPDLVLLDIMMPIMDGFEAARRIKAASQARWTPIIFLSALSRDENLVEGLEAGADDYLTKPVNFVVLEAKLRSMQRSLALQEAALSSAARLQAISDNVLDAIITADERGRITTVNRATERIFGWREEELLGQSIERLMPDSFESRHRQAYDAAVAGDTDRKAGTERDGDAMKRDGTLFPVSVGIRVAQTEEGKLFVAVVRDMSERKAAEKTLKENAALLQAYYDRTHSEQTLALRLMEKQLHRPGLKDHGLRYKVIASEHFSGDIVGAFRSAEGRLYGLLADATGHGLTAAISVLPVLALFYRMTRLNRDIREIVYELNQQLCESMPIGRFVAATMVCLDERQRRGEVWIGGTPDAILTAPDGEVLSRFPSSNLPLGISACTVEEIAPAGFSWPAGAQLVLCSDGLLEAADREGRQFGIERLLRVLTVNQPAMRFTAIETAFAEHLGDATAGDDVSLMVIDCP